MVGTVFIEFCHFIHKAGQAVAIYHILPVFPFFRPGEESQLFFLMIDAAEGKVFRQVEVGVFSHPLPEVQRGDPAHVALIQFFYGGSRQIDEEAVCPGEAIGLGVNVFCSVLYLLRFRRILIIDFLDGNFIDEGLPFFRFSELSRKFRKIQGTVFFVSFPGLAHVGIVECAGERTVFMDFKLCCPGTGTAGEFIFPAGHLGKDIGLFIGLLFFLCRQFAGDGIICGSFFVLCCPGGFDCFCRCSFRFFLCFFFCCLGFLRRCLPSFRLLRGSAAAARQGYGEKKRKRSDIFSHMHILPYLQRV